MKDELRARLELIVNYLRISLVLHDPDIVLTAIHKLEDCLEQETAESRPRPSKTISKYKMGLDRW